MHPQEMLSYVELLSFPYLYIKLYIKYYTFIFNFMILSQ